MRTATVALLVLSAMLAGCTSGTGGGLEASGLEHRAVAERAAHNLDAGAVLVGLVGAEWANETFGDQFVTDSPEAAVLDRGADGNPGNGRALAWGYLFETSGGPALVAVTAGGTVLYADHLDEDSGTAESYGDGLPLGSVAIDSDEAADIVHDNNADFADLVTQDDVVVIMALAQSEDQDDPFWVFTVLRTGEDDDVVFVLVNANDGSYIDFNSFWN